VNALIGDMSITTAPMEGVTENGLVTSTNFASANTFSPDLGTFQQATGAVNGFGDSTATQVGIGAEISFGDGFGDFSASGSAAYFGSPLGIPGSVTPFIPGTPAVYATTGVFDVKPTGTASESSTTPGENSNAGATPGGKRTKKKKNKGKKTITDVKPTGTASESTTIPSETSNAGATPGGKRTKEKKNKGKKVV
jgi:hypothetical protein